jgi:hypothetical protein
MGPKCSCLYNKSDEINTAFLIKSETLSEQPILRGKAFQNEQFRNFSLKKCEDIKKAHKEYEQFVKDLANSKILMKSAINIQTIFRGHLLRAKRIKNIYSELRVEQKNFVKDRMEKFMTDKLKEAENFYPKFVSEGWINYISKVRKGSIKSNPLKTSSLIIVDGKSILEGKIFQNTILTSEDSIYQGESNLNYERHGYGTLLRKGGVQLIGTFVKNNFCGFGRMIDSDGNLLEGIWDQELLKGKGTKKTLDGKVFNGEFTKGKKEGKGTEECEDYLYEGTFAKDLFNGIGKILYKKKNETYEGEFLDGVINGHGTYRWADKQIYTGDWVMGKMHGKGTYKWPNGGEYSGSYENNIKHGNGVWKFTDGKIFDGPISNGVPHGIGQLKLKDKLKEVEFIQGSINKNYKRSPSQISNIMDLKPIEVEPSQN